MMKMINSTNNTSVNGVMLMVDITSSSCAVVTATGRSLLHSGCHEADVFQMRDPGGVEDADDDAVGSLGIGDDRDVVIGLLAGRCLHDRRDGPAVGANAIHEDDALVVDLDV